LEEIKIMLRARKDAMSSFENAKFKLPVISDRSIIPLLRYKEKRQSLLNELSAVPYLHNPKPLTNRITDTVSKQFTLDLADEIVGNYSQVGPTTDSHFVIRLLLLALCSITSN
jgi:hypothetical protein